MITHEQIAMMTNVLDVMVFSNHHHEDEFMKTSYYEIGGEQALKAFLIGCAILEGKLVKPTRGDFRVVDDKGRVSLGDWIDKSKTYTCEVKDGCILLSPT